MDADLLKKGVMAHHKAVGAVSESKAVLSQADFEAVNAALGRMIASVPESQVMDVYNAFSTLTSPDVPAFLMSTVNEADAKAAYAAFLKFKDVVKANHKALVMGASMDGKLLKEAAEAHHKAIGSIDDKLVTSASDFQAINAALGKVIASVPTSQVMDVYNAFGKIVNPVVPNYLFNSVNPADAQAAYAAFLGFKDVVKAAQR